MSFIGAHGPRAREARTLATPLTGSRGSNQQEANPNEEDNKQVQLAIKQIQACAAEVRKETERVQGAAQGAHGCEDSRSLVDAACRRADTAAEDAKRLLVRLAAAGTTENEQTHWRVMERKQKDAMKLATDGLKVALRDYEAAERESQTRRASAVTAGPGSRSNPSSFVVAGLEAPIGSGRRNAAGVEMHAMAQAQDTVHIAEVETHAEITHEYAEQVSRVTQDVFALHGAMRDLATHADAQHDVVDNIESTLLRAAEDSQGVNEELTRTAEGQRKNAKYICAVLVLSVIIALLVVIIVMREAR